MRLRLLLTVLVVTLGGGFTASAADGNRLTYLDEPCDPYYVGRDFPKLITPQWVRESGVDCVVTLGIDDMRGHQKWEAYLRPILERLKKIDGRAPVSIMTCSVDPNEPHLQKWLREGLSLEVHTVDHPCPLLTKGDFAAAKSTYDRCADLMASIPGNRPVAFRTPCCDSLNTPSPRFYAEIFNKTTPKGNYLQLDSSVFHIFTPNDADLPREIVLENGRERFRKYVPFKSFVNLIEDYPYPYVIGGLCWQFPCMVPSDWEAQNVLKPNNPIAVRDLKLALDATVIKKGVFNFVFHPHGWIRNDQVVEFIDYAVAKYGKRVKFLTFRECVERLRFNLLAGIPLRNTDTSGDNGARLIDLDHDGFLDVVIAHSKQPLKGDVLKTLSTRHWSPRENRWKDFTFPTPLVHLDRERGTDYNRHVHFASLGHSGRASVLSMGSSVRVGWHFDGQKWAEDRRLTNGLEIDRQPVMAEREGLDQGVRLRDLDGDGCCELMVANPTQNAVFRWDEKAGTWRKLPFGLPDGARTVDEKGRDAGLRFVDVDEDGHDDVLFSNEERFGLYLFKSMAEGWSRKVRAGKRGDRKAIPLISRNGTNNGAFIHSRHLWVQNEDTHRLADLVDRASFNELLGDAEVGPKTPAAALRSFRVQPGFKIELVAAEPLVMDPVAFDWGPNGKLWVAEMADYPNGIDGKGKPGGRVRVLEDTDGDGRYDKSTVFLDGLAYPNSVMPWRKGVLICAAPDLLYAEDTDGDGRADKREVLFTGFGPGNPQHRYNGLVWGLDNWVYLANGDSGGEIVSKKTGQRVAIRGRDLRIKPDEGLIDPQAGQTQFGRARDDWGNWFGCSNPYPCWHFALEDHYIRRNPHAAAPDPREFVPEQAMYTPVFPISRTLARFNDLHTANRITSACGLTIYRDDLFGPEFANSFFISEPVHNLVHRQVMTSKGVTFTSKRAEDEQISEFVASSDNWFRPTMLRTGPDGALWIADMYRAVIEHPEWIPDDWEARLDLRAGADKGRIYRVYPIGAKLRPIALLDRSDRYVERQQLTGALASPNGWQRDMAHRMLLWRRDPDSVLPLQTRATRDPWALTRLHALCVLDGLGELTDEILAGALMDASNGVRRHAIRLCEGRLQKSPELARKLLQLVDDESAVWRDPHVQLQLAYTLGQWNDPRAGQALGKVMLKHLGDPHISAAALSSLNKNNIEHVLAAVFAGAGERDGADRLIAVLMKQAAAFGDEDALASVIERVCPGEGPNIQWWQYLALAGIFDELDRRRTTPDALRKATGRPSKAALVCIESMMTSAGTLYDNRQTAESARLVVIRLLGRDPKYLDRDLQRLARQLVPQASPALQRAAVERLGRIDNPRVPEVLLADWASHAPPLRRSILDVILSRPTWTASLLDRLEQKVIASADLDAARRQALLAHSDAALRERAAKLLAAGDPSDRAKVVAAYRDVASLRGDAARGREVFAKRCAGCHKLGDVGHVVGPDLAALTNRSLDAMLVATLDPNRAVEDKFISYTALTTDGRQVTGMLAAETGNSITLLAQDGKQEVILRSELDQLKSTGKSLMPEGLEKDVSRQDLADLFVYVTGLGPRRKEFPGNEPVVIRPAADGSLVLSATNCEIFGTAIMLEEKYKNLGHWSTPDSHAVWTIDTPAAATYRVILDYACPHSTAGNSFVLDAGDVRLPGKVAGTESWDEYREMEIGRLALAAGQRTIVLRPEGELKDHLLDLRTIRLVPVK